MVKTGWQGRGHFQWGLYSHNPWDRSRHIQCVALSSSLGIQPYPKRLLQKMLLICLKLNFIIIQSKWDLVNEELKVWSENSVLVWPLMFWHGSVSINDKLRGGQAWHILIVLIRHNLLIKECSGSTGWIWIIKTSAYWSRSFTHAFLVTMSERNFW